MSRQQILDAVWGHDWFGDERTVDVHIAQVRKKLGDACVISTVRGSGTGSSPGRGEAAAPAQPWTRLLVAMASIAVGVLVVTGVTAVALARTSAERTAISNLEDHAPGVAHSSGNSLRCCRTEATSVRSTLGIGRLVTSVLRVTGGTLLTVYPDGTVAEGVAGLADSNAFGADTRVAPRFRQGPPNQRPAAANQLPAGLTVEDFDADRLLGGEQQTGAVNGQVFIAEPIRSGHAAHRCWCSPRRSTRRRSPGARVLPDRRGAGTDRGRDHVVLRCPAPHPSPRRDGRTAAAIAGGDFAARVDLGRHPDDELRDLARTLNGMGVQLEHARHGERAFLLSVSHDLRTPLTSIRGYAEALTDGTIPASDEQQRAGAVIAAEANRLERLVADLLDLARLDARQFSLSPREFDVDATVRTAVEAFLPAANELGIELRIDAAAGQPAVGDPERVAQIVANLVENALKSAGEDRRSRRRRQGRRRRNASRRRRAGNRPRRSAPGLRAAVRLAAVPGRSVGTGLGLAIVGELATAMGGSAAVDAVTAGGAAFSFSLPLLSTSTELRGASRSTGRGIAPAVQDHIGEFVPDVVGTFFAEVRSVGPEFDPRDPLRAASVRAHDRREVEDRHTTVGRRSGAAIQLVQRPDSTGLAEPGQDHLAARYGVGNGEDHEPGTVGGQQCRGTPNLTGDHDPAIRAGQPNTAATEFTVHGIPTREPQHEIRSGLGVHHGPQRGEDRFRARAGPRVQISIGLESKPPQNRASRSSGGLEPDPPGGERRIQAGSERGRKGVADQDGVLGRSRSHGAERGTRGRGRERWALGGRRGRDRARPCQDERDDAGCEPGGRGDPGAAAAQPGADRPLEEHVRQRSRSPA